MRSVLRTAGFTLVELMIVVVILAILAAVAIPQFTNSAEEAKESALQANLGVLRNSLELYKLQHNSIYPGYPSAGGAPTEAEFINQMTLASKTNRTTAALGTAGFNLGPYLKERVPPNPYSGLSTVSILLDAAAFPVAGDDSTGWVFKPATGQIRANSTGTAPSGTNWFDF